MRPRLAINAENEAIKELAKLPPDSEAIKGGAYHLAHFAEHLSAKRMTRQQLITHSDCFTALVSGLKEMLQDAASGDGSPMWGDQSIRHAKRWLDLANQETVAVVYADLVGSSKLFSNLGRDDWDRILALYCEGVVDGVWEYGGAFDSFTGDGFIAMFPCSAATESCLALEGVENLVQDIRKLFMRDTAVKSILKNAGIRATGLSRYAITAGPVTIRELGGRTTGTGVPLVLGARLVGDKALFGNSRCVVVAESYVTCDNAIDAVSEIKDSPSQNFKDGKYVYADFGGVRDDRLFEPK